MTSACTIPNLNTIRYSSPVPIIGLYITAGSSVCFLLMLFDIISAYRRRQSWIPCRFFCLNSFTLTMLAIASKLQVDLTTPMPGVPDQLLKLTGSTLLCICMGFLNLSVGNNGDSEYLSNMTALSIMIITVVVNICIQLSTGVIHLFVAEHIIMMFCLLVVLLLMWFCARETKNRNHKDIAWVTEILNQYQSFNRIMNLLGRLKACYAIGFDKTPQLRACRDMGNLTLVPFCLVCCCVLVEAIVRSVVVKQLRFCSGASDYEWSTWFILVTQILSVFLGCFAICFRWFTSFPFVNFWPDFEEYVGEDESMKMKFTAIFGSPSCYKLGIYLQTSVFVVVVFLGILVLFPPILLFSIFGGKIHKREELSTSVKEFIGQLHGCEYRNIFRHDQYPCNWIMEKVMIDIDKYVKESRRGSPKELLELFSRITPQLHNFAPIDDMASPLPLAALVKTAITCIPEEASTKTLVLCFHEAIDILQTFIDPKDPRYAVFMRNPLMVDEDFDDCHHAAIYRADNSIYEHCRGSNRQWNENYLGEISNMLAIKSEGHNKVTAEIRNRWCDTGDDLYGVIEQLFVDMLHLTFAAIPNAVFKSVTECPMDGYKERVRHVLVTVLKIAPLEDYVKWSFPENSNISSLKPLETHAADDQNNGTEGVSDANTSSSPREDNMARVDITSSSNHDHVALEIEEL